MTNHQTFRKFCHFLKKVGFYKEYWQIVYKAGFSKKRIREDITPDRFIVSMSEYVNGIVSRVRFYELSLKWKKELHPPKNDMPIEWWDLIENINYRF